MTKVKTQAVDPKGSAWMFHAMMRTCNEGCCGVIDSAGNKGAKEKVIIGAGNALEVLRNMVSTYVKGKKGR